MRRLDKNAAAVLATDAARDAYNRGRTGQERDRLPGEPADAPLPATDPWLAGHVDAWLARTYAPHEATRAAAAREAILGYHATDPEDAHRSDYPTILRRAGWSGR